MVLTGLTGLTVLTVLTAVSPQDDVRKISARLERGLRRIFNELRFRSWMYPRAYTAALDWA